MKKCVLIFIFITYFTTAAQEKSVHEATGSLEQLIALLKETHQINFSYNAKSIGSYVGPYSIKYHNLSQSIRKLTKDTRLQFIKIVNGDYIIVNKNKPETSFCGQVLDFLTGKPIPASAVFNELTKFKVLSDSLGYFKIKNSDNNFSYSISKNQYQTLQISAESFSQKDSCTTFYLLSNVEVLDEVIIHNYLTKGYTKNKNGSIKVDISKNSLFPGQVDPDVLQNLQFIPGIQSADESVSGINIRGGTPDQNLILWDGIKMYHSDHFFGMLSSFNPYTTENVTIFKNASNAHYRSHLAGVIDIQTQNEIPVKFEGGMGINMIYADAYLKTPLYDNVGLVVAARRSYADISETITFDEFSEHIFQNTKITKGSLSLDDEDAETDNTYYFEELNVKVLTKPTDKSSLNISGYYTDNFLDFRSSFPTLEQATQDKLDIRNTGVGITYNNKISDSTTLKVNTSATSYSFDYLGEEVLSEFFFYETLKSNTIQEFSFTGNLIHHLNNLHNINGGYSFTHNALEYEIGRQSDVYFDPDFKVSSTLSINNTHALFGEHIFKNNGWSARSGIRINYYNRVKDLFLEPRFYLSKKVNNNAEFNISGEITYQPISQIREFETQNFGLENQIWILSDSEDIPVLKSEQISIGGNYKKDKWYIDTTIYYKYLNGLTTLTKGFSRERRSTQLSSGNSTVYGLEILAKKDYANFSTICSYALTQNKLQFDSLNEGEDFFGNFDIRHYFSVIQNATFNKLELSASWRFKSGNPYTEALGIGGSTNANFIRYGAINSSRLEDYNRFDISAMYKFNPFENRNINVKIGASLINVLNTQYDINRTYRLVFNNDKSEVVLREDNKVSIGRTPNFMLHIDF